MIDVYLLSGFLGSGKTSLLLHLIEQVKGNRTPAVLMNEFGELNFDGEAVDRTSDVPLKELLNGCICCTGAESTEAQLQSLLEDYEGVDVIFIETTGAAHPVEALDAVYSPLFADRLNVKGIITVVDAKRWTQRDALTPQIRSLFLEQIRHAHLLLLNKVDLLTPDELAKVTMEVANFHPGAPLVQTSGAKIDMQFVENTLRQPVSMTTSDIRSARGLSLSSKLIILEQPVNQEEFEEWIRTLPETVYRMKGYILLEGSRYPHMFQYAYGMVNWMPDFIKMPSRFVIIGENVDQIQYP